jgi:hypothetical protein
LTFFHPKITDDATVFFLKKRTAAAFACGLQKNAVKLANYKSDFFPPKTITGYLESKLKFRETRMQNTNSFVIKYEIFLF